MEFVQNFYPATFLELLGGFLAVVAVVAGLASLMPELRVHLLKLLSIVFICSLALFSNHVSTYFVAIFVIATAVTELDFLQNLAAIIRGNDGYFNYKKEALSRESKLGNVAADVAQADILSSSGLDVADEPCAEGVRSETGLSGSESSSADESSDLAKRKAAEVTANEIDDPLEIHDTKPKDVIMLKNVGALGGDNSNAKIPYVSESNRLRRVLALEDRAFDRLELSHKAAIERGVRLVSKTGRHVELDGLITGGRRSDIIFETKYLRSSRNFIAWLKLVASQLNRMRGEYKEITNRDAEIHFVLILEQGVVLTARQQRELNDIGADNVYVFAADYLIDKK